MTPFPRHVAVIMDGNGRWAAERGLPRHEGHRRGADAVRRIVHAALDLGVSTLTLYAFSAQNWGRPQTEVAHLMRLLGSFVVKERAELSARGVRVVTIGDVRRLPAFARAPLDALEIASAGNSAMTLCLALSYGGREAIASAARSLAADVAGGRLRAEDVTEEKVAARLDTSALPPLDLLIRTSGEQRLSNFLLWESAYAELHFTPVLWPDFDRHTLQLALDDYARRQRRFGLTADQAQSRRNAKTPRGKSEESQDDLSVVLRARR
jgi:undecaprenyl diphosphate synthase